MVLVSTPALPGAGPEQANLFIQDDNIGFSDANPVSGSAYLGDRTGDEQRIRRRRRRARPVQDVSGEDRRAYRRTADHRKYWRRRQRHGADHLDVTGAAGDRIIEVTVDPFNLVPESNESDNEASRALVVQEKPAANLMIADENISFNPSCIPIRVSRFLCAPL